MLSLLMVAERMVRSPAALDEPAPPHYQSLVSPDTEGGVGGKTKKQRRSANAVAIESFWVRLGS